MTPDAFAARVRAVPDLDLSWTYWPVLIPEMTGRAVFWLFVWPALRGLA